MPMRFLQPDIAALPDVTECPEAAPIQPELEVIAYFDEYRNPLLRFLLSLGLSAVDGEEVIQETFLALLQHLRATKPRTNLRGWLFQVGHNQALKRRKRRPAAALAPIPVPTPEEQAIAKQTHERLAAAIKSL